MRRVVVTGLGAVTPLGVGIRKTWNSLINSQSGIVSTASWGPLYASIPSQVAGAVPKGTRRDGGWNAEEWVTREELKKAATFTHFALAASQEALEDAGWMPTKDEDLEATGVCLGSGIGNLDALHDQAIAYQDGKYHKILPTFVPRILINLGAGHISMRWGFKGPNHSVSTACTTGAHSIGDATRIIQTSSASVMLAGGSEAALSPLSLAGFSRARSLSTHFNATPTAASRPFDKSRDGFVIAEGAAVLVLEELEHARQRGARIYAEVVGYGMSADAWHLTAPRPDGDGALRAMRMVLKQANANPEDVAYINAHATGTVLGDRAENTAITRLLSSSGSTSTNPSPSSSSTSPSPPRPLISSTKSSVGHLLGAAGALEAAFTILALTEGVVPPTLNLDQVDDGFGVGFGFDYVPHTARDVVWKEGDVLLSNSFGFGGTNACLGFRRVE